MLARNNTKRWALGAKGGLAMQYRRLPESE
jgi:hypothetical protein